MSRLPSTEKCHLTWRRIEAHSTVVILVLECSSIFAAASELVVCSCRRAFWPLKKKKQAVKSFQSRPQTLLTKLCFIKCMFYFEVYRRKRKLLLRLILFQFWKFFIIMKLLWQCLTMEKMRITMSWNMQHSYSEGHKSRFSVRNSTY